MFTTKHRGINYVYIFDFKVDANYRSDAMLLRMRYYRQWR